MRIALLALTGFVYSILAYSSYLWFTEYNGIHPLLSIATAIAVTLVTITALSPTNTESP